jgi:hypothetical protein
MSPPLTEYYMRNLTSNIFRKTKVRNRGNVILWVIGMLQQFEWPAEPFTEVKPHAPKAPEPAKPKEEIPELPRGINYGFPPLQ